MKNQHLYLGTWQFSGLPPFKQFSDEEIILLLEESLAAGVYGFDTALVYGNMEKLIGHVLKTHNNSPAIITKIPALEKPPLTTAKSIEHYYSEHHMWKCIETSLYNLQTDRTDIVLLHNWAQNWGNNTKHVFRVLEKMKDTHLVRQIGISLPNNYEVLLHDNILEHIDVLEVPYNDENPWSKMFLPICERYNIEVVLRSTLKTGKAVSQHQFCAEKHIQEISNLGTSITIGMSSSKQIQENCNYFNQIISKKIKNNLYESQ